MAAKQTFARVCIGYDTYVLPLKQATQLVELLAEAKQVNDVDFSLVDEFRPELKGQYVTKKVQQDVRLNLIASDALPYFDEEGELAALRAERDGHLIAPYTIGKIESRYRVLQQDGTPLDFSSWSYKEALNHAIEVAQAFHETPKLA